ncbi:hypothetical protein SK128_023101 [Halocaridina rubra]|uniref:Uncharacterized protein n=1 Tax=Halocaridina rubra TaxID=373956 RepID=A0AAN8XF19_HALRR
MVKFKGNMRKKLINFHNVLEIKEDQNLGLPGCTLDAIFLLSVQTTCRWITTTSISGGHEFDSPIGFEWHLYTRSYRSAGLAGGVHCMVGPVNSSPTRDTP